MSLLIIGPGGTEKLRRNRIAAWLKDDGRILLVGLKGSESNSILPFTVQTKPDEHIASYFEASKPGSPFAGVSSADVHSRVPLSGFLLTDGADLLGDGILASTSDSKVAFCQAEPWKFSSSGPMNQKRTFRRAAFLLSRIAASMGAACSSPLLDNVSRPLDTARNDKRWLNGLYLDVPEEWDDPYRFFEW